MPLGLPDLGEFPKHQPRCHSWAQFQQEDIHTRACRRTQSVFSSGFRPVSAGATKSTKHSSLSTPVQVWHSKWHRYPTILQTRDLHAELCILRIQQPSVVSRAAVCVALAVCRRCTCSFQTLRSSMLFARKRSRVLRAPGPKGAPRLRYSSPRRALPAGRPSKLLLKGSSVRFFFVF